MKKIAILFLSVAFFGLNQSFAQQADTNPAIEPIAVAEEKAMESIVTDIALADLPAAVQTVLQADDYKGWTASKVHHVKKEGAEFYKIIMTMEGQEDVKVKLDANGQPYQHKKEEGKE